MFKYIHVMAAVMVFVATGAAAAENAPPPLPQQLDLKTALRMALEFNPTLNKARERIRGQAGSLAVSESARLPHVGAFGSYALEEESRSGSFGASEPPDEDSWRAGVEVTQPLYAGGIINSSIRSKNLLTESLEAEREETYNMVMADTARKFYRALLARETILVRKESLDLLQKQLRLAKNRYEAGAVSRFDVMQTEVRLANVRPPLIRAENDYISSIEDLRTTLGINHADQRGPGDVTLVGVWAEPSENPELDTAIQQALANRPDLISEAKKKDSARELVLRARRQHAPRVDAFANYSVENDRFDPSNDRLDGWQVGIQAKLSIWEGGRIRGEVTEAQSVYEQAVLSEQELRLAIELDVRNAWNRTIEAKEILNANALAITQAEEALRLAENRYAAGTLTQLDVLASQLDFTQAKLDQLTALYDYTIAYIDLRRAMGDRPANEWLEE